MHISDIRKEIHVWQNYHTKRIMHYRLYTNMERSLCEQLPRLWSCMAYDLRSIRCPPISDALSLRNKLQNCISSTRGL